MTTIHPDLPPQRADDEVPPPARPELFERVVQGAHDTVDKVAEAAAPHMQRIQERVSSANQTLHDKADQVRGTGEEWTACMRDSVRERPLAWLLGAALTGLVIASCCGAD